MCVTCGYNWCTGQPVCLAADGLPGATGNTPNSDIYKFSTSTGGAPASGIVSVDNANVLGANTITINITDLAGNNMSSWLGGIDFGQNASAKSFVQIFNKDTPSKFVTYRVTTYALAGSIVTLTVVPLGGSGASPFANNDKVIFAYVISGDDGKNGAIIEYNGVYPTASLPKVDSNTAGVPQSMDSFDASNLMANNGDVLRIHSTFVCPDANVVSNDVKCYLNVNGVLNFNPYTFGFPLQGYNIDATISRINATTAFVDFRFSDTQNIYPSYADTGIITGVDWTSLLIENMGSTTVTMASAVYLYSLQLEIEYIAKA